MAHPELPDASPSGPARCIVDATIWTMETPSATAQAILWQGGRITAVGDRDEVTLLARRAGASIESMPGMLVIPGFMDAHMHFLHVGVRQLRPDLRGATSRQDAEDRTRAWLEAHPGADPVIAEGWDESQWPDSRFPTRSDLDRLAPDRPLVWRRMCGHIAVANTQALPPIQSRWGPEHVDPDSGLLEEDASLYLNEVLPATPEQLDRALETAQNEAHRLGVTAVGEYTQAPFREALLRADRDGRLRVRLANHIYTQMLDEQIAAGFRTGHAHSDWLRDGGLKVFLDGSFGGRTAYMREPYLDDDDDPDNRGTPIWTDAELDRWFEDAHQAGIQITAHAIGDAAIDQGLDAYERLANRHPDERPIGARLRHRFEHYELPHDDALERTVHAGVWACAQPNFVGEWSAPGGMYHQRMGDVFLLNNRYRTFLKAGLELSFGSDGMPFGPLFGLQAALDHPVEEERLTLQEAIWLYTHRAAAACHWEDKIGTLQPGRCADLLLVETGGLESPASSKPTEWIIQETIVDGKTRHRGNEPAPMSY